MLEKGGLNIQYFLYPLLRKLVKARNTEKYKLPVLKKKTSCRSMHDTGEIFNY